MLVIKLTQLLCTFMVGKGEEFGCYEAKIEESVRLGHSVPPVQYI